MFQMSFHHVLALVCLVGTAMAAHRQHRTTTTPKPKTLEDLMHEKMDVLEKLMETVARQLMLQQLYYNERIRGGYNTGVKQIRYTRDGPRSYDTESHTGQQAGAIHDHPEQYRTMGLGEMDVVLNGIEFRTRSDKVFLCLVSGYRSAVPLFKLNFTWLSDGYIELFV